MPRASRVAAIFLVLASTGLAAIGGCTALFDIEEKQLTTGAGGAGSSSTGGMTSSSSGEMTSSSSGGTTSSSSSSAASSGSGGNAAFLCDFGAPPRAGCLDDFCDNTTSTVASVCHCGACNHDCGGAGCADSTCQVSVAAGASGFSYAISTNGKDVFYASFVEPSNDIPETTIYKLPFGATAMDTPIVLSHFNGRVRFLAAGCNEVYFAITAESGGGKSSIPRIAYVNVDAQDEQPTDLFPGVEADGVVALETDDNFVYWAANAGSVLDRGVKAFRKSDAMIQHVDNLPPQPLTDIAVEGGYLYWAAGNAIGGSIRRAKIPSSQSSWNPEAVRLMAGWPVSIVVDKDSVYWLDFIGTSAQLRKAPKDAPMAPKFDLATLDTVSVSMTASAWLGIDAMNVYAINELAGIGTVVRLGKTSGSRTTVASDANSIATFNAQTLVMDARRVYFTGPAAMSQILWVAK